MRALRPAHGDVAVVAATLTSDAEVDALVGALGAERRFLVRLEADGDTLRDRILAREPSGWSGLPALVSALPSLAARIAGLAGVDLVVRTDERPPVDVAREVRLSAGL